MSYLSTLTEILIPGSGLVDWSQVPVWAILLLALFLSTWWGLAVWAIEQLYGYGSWITSMSTGDLMLWLVRRDSGAWTLVVWFVSRVVLGAAVFAVVVPFWSWVAAFVVKPLT
jgi:hypothetical protein